MPTGAESFEELPDHLQRLVPLIAAGKTNQQIAEAEYLTVHTVENYVSQIMERTGYRPRSEPVVRAMQWVS